MTKNRGSQSKPDITVVNNCNESGYEASAPHGNKELEKQDRASWSKQAAVGSQLQRQHRSGVQHGGGLSAIRRLCK